MATMRIVVHHVKGDVLRATSPSGHEIVMDSSPPGGGEGPSPVEMLLTAVAACSLMDVASILTKKRLAFRDLRAIATGERRDTQPRAFTSLKVRFEVTGDVPREALETACRLSVDKYCSVMATVRESPPLSWEAHVNPS